MKDTKGTINIDRAMYKTIKRYDRQQLEVFTTNIYKQGFDAGMRKITESLSTKLVHAIKNTKGIGEARFNLLIKNITRELMKEPEESVEEQKIC